MRPVGPVRPLGGWKTLKGGERCCFPIIARLSAIPGLVMATLTQVLPTSMIFMCDARRRIERAVHWHFLLLKKVKMASELMVIPFLCLIMPLSRGNIILRERPSMTIISSAIIRTIAAQKSWREDTTTLVAHIYKAEADEKPSSSPKLPSHQYDHYLKRHY